MAPFLSNLIFLIEVLAHRPLFRLFNEPSGYQSERRGINDTHK